MSNVDPNRKPSNLGRYLFLFLFGLADGRDVHDGALDHRCAAVLLH